MNLWDREDIKLWDRMQQAANAVAEARGGNDGHNLIEAAAKLTAVLHEQDEYIEALKRKGLIAIFRQREPKKYV